MKIYAFVAVLVDIAFLEKNNGMSADLFTMKWYAKFFS